MMRLITRQEYELLPHLDRVPRGREVGRKWRHFRAEPPIPGRRAGGRWEVGEFVQTRGGVQVRWSRVVQLDRGEDPWTRGAPANEGGAPGVPR